VLVRSLKPLCGVFCWEQNSFAGLGMRAPDNKRDERQNQDVDQSLRSGEGCLGTDSPVRVKIQAALKYSKARGKR
jgi:hypothetical protein